MSVHQSRETRIFQEYRAQKDGEFILHLFLIQITP